MPRCGRFERVEVVKHLAWLGQAPHSAHAVMPARCRQSRVGMDETLGIMFPINNFYLNEHIGHHHSPHGTVRRAFTTTQTFEEHPLHGIIMSKILHILRLACACEEHGL